MVRLYLAALFVLGVLCPSHTLGHAISSAAWWGFVFWSSNRCRGVITRDLFRKDA